jgi:hypothetical protein
MEIGAKVRFEITMGSLLRGYGIITHIYLANSHLADISNNLPIHYFTVATGGCKFSFRAEDLIKINNLELYLYY